jgi:hypothetical protein
MKHFPKYIARELKVHAFDYLVLITGGIFFLLAAYTFQGNKYASFVAVTAFCVLYILWGMYHHYRLGNLHIKNVVEYILIGFTFLYLLKIILSL